MNIDAITADLLKRTLKAWQQAQPMPKEWFTLAWLKESNTSSKIEQELWLQEQITQLVVDTLLYLRRAEGLPDALPVQPTRQELLHAFIRDIRQDSDMLRGWSALYHRFLAPLSLGAEEMAIATEEKGKERTINRWIEAGVERLAHRLRQLEQEARSHFRTHYLRRNLPRDEHHQLIGVKSLCYQITNWLCNSHGPPFVSLEGMGGIGKTAMAWLVVHDLAENHPNLTDIAWISARQQWIHAGRGQLEQAIDPVRSLDEIVTRLVIQLGLMHLAGLGTTDKLERLRPLLALSPYLVVIDNLETLADVDALLPALRPLAGTSRFLFTSRHTMSHETDVQVLTVPPLTKEDGLTLLEYELRRRDLRATITGDVINALYETVGGLPLFLKLAAAQIRSISLPHFLHRVQAAQHRTQQAWYDYIYHQSWDMLSEDARHLLLNLLDISPDGETIEWLQLMSSLPNPDFDEALAQLVDYSLVEIGGTIDNPTYHLHRLTVTFLQTNILGGWL